MQYPTTLTAILLIAFSQAVSAAVVDFEELTVYSGTSGIENGQPGGQFYNGDSGNGNNSNGWSSGGLYFSNSFDRSEFNGITYESWTGWAYSNVQNNLTPGFTNQYASFPGSGAGGSSNYAIAFAFPGDITYMNIDAGMEIAGLDISNTTYSYLALRDGVYGSKPFGGNTGNDPDLFTVTLSGYDAAGATGNQIGSVDFNLADFRAANNSLDYIVDAWTTLDLSALASARSIALSFTSTDAGQFGINTPTYVAIDNIRLTAVPEPNSLALLSLASWAMCARRRRSH
ncbi:DUF4465 domain-containing protein [Aureliella helgolandensis]|uniref:Ice-binding protein C-terminal domain-containing protein n=1 Tax=Aureliella helgolandensis TaxID=2527968 RepID=A0A518GH66_9BACT|nr:DUF4465 domain-containing protein [Aureliella helgolandensis]QDV27908.1 hypothetical protein Q31a_63010 [Aureliella helgolandensis]